MTEKIKMAKNESMPEIKPSETDDIFRLVKSNGKVKIAIANHQISQKEFNSYKEAEEYIASKPYELIFNATMLFVNFTIKSQNNESKTNPKNA